ncbi:LuxR C-terminal-related transcriptional regulator [Actinokineospora auranticolor]|uniref:DNA-binding NarL/FixJ family response regulator n=1 Tax=Actinokineospora auranticolor TaxID=155976 RepID=A0A2S6GD99_9PSEU|nr:LuxR C-terminal-related transcriptional regulator [Actinokineospora auranticolor]PPK63182.1 DNA-binding NarL/FixJ family response regulator [Actinokineospora auranticolor]
MNTTDTACLRAVAAPVESAHARRLTVVRSEPARVRVGVRATDPLTAVGVAESLAGRREVLVLPEARIADAEVFVVAAERAPAEAVSLVRATADAYPRPQVLVTGGLAPGDLLTVVGCRVVVVLPRAAATSDRLVGGIRDAAAGRGALPPHQLGELLRQVGAAQREAPRGMGASRLHARELDVVRLLADGHDTPGIAVRLRYSERTVKNIIHAMSVRLRLRNRAHAVAYAIRVGVV